MARAFWKAGEAVVEPDLDDDAAAGGVDQQRAELGGASRGRASRPARASRPRRPRARPARARRSSSPRSRRRRPGVDDAAEVVGGRQPGAHRPAARQPERDRRRPPAGVRRAPPRASGRSARSRRSRLTASPSRGLRGRSAAGVDVAGGDLLARSGSFATGPRRRRSAGRRCRRSPRGQERHQVGADLQRRRAAGLPLDRPLVEACHLAGPPRRSGP